MEPPAPTSLLTESFSLFHIETIYVSSDGTEACIAAFVQDSMWLERTSAGIVGLSLIKSAEEAGSSTLMED